jgi:hypothetical protein
MRALSLAVVVGMTSCATPTESRHAEVTVDDAQARVAAFETRLSRGAPFVVTTIDDALQARPLSASRRVSGAARSAK